MTGPFPFEDLLDPVVAEARRELRARFAPKRSWLAESALKDLERGLLRSVSNLLGQALGLRFSLFRVFALLNDGSSQNLYERFVAKVAAEGLDGISQQYPALEMALGRLTETWVDASSEFLVRLECDAGAIQETFGRGQELGPLVALQTSVSDRHDGGRAVVIAEFSSGLRVVYKPKHVGPERVFYDIVRWLNSQDMILESSVPIVLEGSGYGWVEFVEQKSCTEREAIRRYYRRAGQLACLLYALCASDCHFGNLIACGEHPILIDAETVFQPVELSASGSTRIRTALSTGLLPGSCVRGVDVSALGVRPGAGVPLRVATWTDINTDTMKLNFTPGRLVAPKSLPSLDGNVVSIRNHVDDLLEGFGNMYRTLLRCREALFATSGPLAPMREQSVRFLMRDSLEYYVAINSALHLSKLRGKTELDIQLSELPLRRRVFRPLTPFEETELRLLDVPRYMISSKARDLGGAGYSIPDCFEQSGYDHVIQTMERLSEEDLRQQSALIRLSLSSKN